MANKVHSNCCNSRRSQWADAFSLEAVLESSPSLGSAISDGNLNSPSHLLSCVIGNERVVGI